MCSSVFCICWPEQRARIRIFSASVIWASDRDVAGLAGWVEFFFGSVALGDVLFGVLYLLAGAEGADQDFFCVGDLGFRSERSGPGGLGRILLRLRRAGRCALRCFVFAGRSRGRGSGFFLRR